LSSTFGSVTFGFLSVIYVPYLGFVEIDATLIGVLMMVSFLTIALLTIPFGILADRYGRKPFLVMNSLLHFAYSLFYLFRTDFAALLLAELLGGTGSAMSWAPSAALISDKTVAERRKYAFGLSWFWSSVGTTLGFLMSAIPDFLVSTQGWNIIESSRMMFGVAAVLWLASFFPLALIREEKSAERHVDASRRINITSWRLIAKFSFTNGLVGLGAGFIVPWFSYYFLQKFGVSYASTGAVFAVSQGGMAVSFLLSPKLSERIGNVNAVVVTQIVSIMALVLIALSPNFGVASVFYVIRVILMNMTHPVWTGFFMSLVTEKERASANSVATTSWMVPNALSRPVAGYILEHLSLDMPFFICASLYSTSSALFYLFFHRLEKSKE
jgi:MFS family permease